ncbi:MAG: hypothetical protein HY657_00350 [Acidobacteria bacterium]|nr:hypothetical protein [Acidobacteriota bacterium]
MTRYEKLAAWGFAVLALAAALAFGPLFAGYLFAGLAFAVITALMGLRIARAIDDWHLEHPLKFRRRRASATPGTEERRAA